MTALEHIPASQKGIILLLVMRCAVMNARRHSVADCGMGALGEATAGTLAADTRMQSSWQDR
jgi:hypothetical protein